MINHTVGIEKALLAEAGYSGYYPRLCGNCNGWHMCNSYDDDIAPDGTILDEDNARVFAYETSAEAIAAFLMNSYSFPIMEY